MHRSTAAVRLTVALVAAAVALSACRDSTAPDRGPRVFVSLTRVDGPIFSNDAQGNPTIECDPYIRAIVTGENTASWQTAKVRWFWGPDRTRAADSTTIAASDVRASWGGSGLVPPDTLTSAWAFTAPAPFEAEIVYGYQGVGTAARSDSVRFICGPLIQPGTPGPTVEPPVIDSPSGDVQAGDTIRLRYSAAAAATLWQLVIRFTGACQYQYMRFERLASSVSAVDPIEVPAGCLLGQQLGITVTAIDAAGRVASASLANGPTVVDTRPPTLSPLANLPGGRGGAAATLAGTLFSGETVDVVYNARDNTGVSMLYWEESVSGTRDSLWAPLGDDMKIVMRAEWVGPVRFRFWVRDRAGLTSDTVATVSGALSVAPVTPYPVRTASVAGTVRDVAYDATRQAVYLAEQSPNRIAVLSLASMTLVDSVAMPDIPVSIDLTPGGDSLLAVLPTPRALAVLDLRGGTPAVSTNRLSALDSLTSSYEIPGVIAVMANGKALVGLSTAADGSAPTILELDLATGAQRLRADAQRNGRQAYALARSGDRGMAVLNEGCFQRYTAATDSFTPCRTDSPTYEAATVDAAGATVAASWRIFDGSLSLVRTVPSVYPATSGDIWAPLEALSPDGSILNVIDWQLGVIRFRTSDGSVADAIPNAQLEPSTLVATPDGRWLISVRPSTASTISAIGLQ